MAYSGLARKYILKLPPSCFNDHFPLSLLLSLPPLITTTTTTTTTTTIITITNVAQQPRSVLGRFVVEVLDNAHTHARTHTHTYARTHAHTHTHIHTPHTYIHTHTHTHTTHIHTHTHTHLAGLLWTNDQLVAEVATYTTHNKHKRRISMASAGFEPAVREIERPETYALKRMATEIGNKKKKKKKKTATANAH